MISRQLRAELLKQLNVGQRRLNQRIRDRINELPMSREDAAYTIAFEVGIDLSKHISPEEIADVRKIVAEMRMSEQADLPKRGVQSGNRAAKSKTVTLKIRGLDKSGVPGLTTRHVNEAKEMAEKVYPMLYVFENSVRSVIERVLANAHGSQWWDVSVPKKVRDTAHLRQNTEKNNPWHGRRGAREIDYVDLSQLWQIINHRWSDFKHLFPNKAWVESLIENDMKISRNPIAHMNPIAPDDVRNIEVAFKKWTRQLQGVASSIP